MQGFVFRMSNDYILFFHEKTQTKRKQVFKLLPFFDCYSAYLNRFWCLLYDQTEMVRSIVVGQLLINEFGLCSQPVEITWGQNTGLVVFLSDPDKCQIYSSCCTIRTWLVFSTILIIKPLKTYPPLKLKYYINSLLCKVERPLHNESVDLCSRPRSVIN